MPTELERNGDYSQSLNGSGGLRTIYDPWSTVTDANGNVTRTAFAGNVIPTARLDPIAVKFTSLLWKPTSAGLGPYHTNNYAINLPVSYPYRNYSDRVDYNLNDKLRLYGRVGFIRTNANPSNPTGSPLFENDRGSIRNADQYTGNLTYTINATTVLRFAAIITALWTRPASCRGRMLRHAFRSGPIRTSISPCTLTQASRNWFRECPFLTRAVLIRMCRWERKMAGGTRRRTLMRRRHPCPTRLETIF